MAEDISNPAYWDVRASKPQTEGNEHQAVYICPRKTWMEIEGKHEQLLQKYIGDNTSVFDAGCAWGRLLDLLPPTWNSHYLGVDLSPAFIDKARHLHLYPRRSMSVAFHVHSLLDLSAFYSLMSDGPEYDLAVCVSIRAMVIRNSGHDVWHTMETEIRKVAKRILYLEYDETCEGVLE